MDSPSQGHMSKPFTTLSVLNSKQPHAFLKPSKRICEGHDVPTFLTSRAYVDIGIFVMHLNVAMCPRKIPTSPHVQTWQLDVSVPSPEAVCKLQELLQKIDAIVEEAPPETGPRRFGNASFRKWYEILESRVCDLLRSHLPAGVLSFDSNTSATSALDEIVPYFLGSFGSPQRLDYGTGHELSFLAFLGCIWKLGGFSEGHAQDGSIERSIVMEVIEPYVLPVSALKAYIDIWKQIPTRHSTSYSHIYTRACWFPRSVGSRRSLFPTVHFWIRSVLSRD
jgi:serine/threonine-protein phosphatase 2A activator